MPPVGRVMSNTPADAFQAVAQLGADSTAGVDLAPGCDDAIINDMQSAAERELGEPIPQSYVRLLRITNGVQINGAYLKKAEHVVPENLDVPRPEIIVLGEEGNTAEFVFDKRDRQFHVINMGHPDERFASFGTFDEMLLNIMKEQQVL